MLVRAFSVMLAGSLIVSAGALGLMVSQREIPVEILERKVESPSVRPGGHLTFRLTFIQHRRCHIHTDRALFDSSNIRYLLDPLEFQAGLSGANGDDKPQEYTIKVPVPPEMNFGPARYEASTVYTCNIIHLLWPIRPPPSILNFEVTPL